MFFQCFERLQVREDEISLYKWSGDTAQFRTLATGAGIPSNVRVGYFSVSQSHNGFATVRRDEVYFTILLWQNSGRQNGLILWSIRQFEHESLIRKWFWCVVFRIVQNHGE